MKTFRSIIATSLTVASVTLLIAACGKGDPEKAVASAKEYLAKRDISAATIELKNALASSPNHAEARFLLATALLESGDLSSAEIELKKAVEHKVPLAKTGPLMAQIQIGRNDPKAALETLDHMPLPTEAGELADYHVLRGQALAMVRDLVKAKASFESAIAARPDQTNAHIGLARVHAASGNLEETTRIIDELNAKQPNSADAWQFKGDLLRLGGSDDDALKAYLRAVELKPRAVIAHGAIIMIHLRAQRVDMAEKQAIQLEKAVGSAPLVTYSKGLVAFAKKDFETAKKHVDALLKIQPDNPQSLQLAGAIAFETKSDVQAQEYLSKAIQKVPGLDYGRRVLVNSYLRSGQPAKAIAALQPVLQGGKPSRLWSGLAGDAYLQNGEPKIAAEHFRNAATADPQSVRAKTALAVSNLRMGSVDQAFVDLERIAAADKGTTADMALIAAAMSQQQYDKAIKAIDVLIGKDPKNPAPYQLRGTALLGKKDRTAARTQFEKALEVNPVYLPAATALAQLDFADQKPDAAKSRFESVLAKEPKNTTALLALAELRGRTGGSASDVTAMITKAVSASPNEPAPRVALIGHLLRNKDAKGAQKAAQDALAAIPDRPEILDLAGRAFAVAGDTNQALATFAKLTTMTPGAIQPYLQMTELHLAAKNFESARSSVAKGLSIDENSVALLRAAIMVDVADGRHDAALTRARDMQRKNPKHPAGYVLEGDIRLAQKVPDKAVAAYEAGLKAAPTTDLAERLYSTLNLTGKRAEATQFATNWAKAHPKDDVFRLFVADAALRAKDFGAAIDQYRKLLTANPKNPAVLNNLAYALGRTKSPEAIPTAEKANELAPNQPAIMDTLGTLLIADGKFERGLEFLTKASDGAPESAEIRLNLAKGLIAAGKKSDARKQLDLLSKLGDKHPAHAEVAALIKSL